MSENTLFNQKTIERLTKKAKITPKQKKAAEKWLSWISEGDLLKEKQGYLKFYDIILKELLGFEEIVHEKEGVEFSYEKDGKTIARIEAKGMDTRDLFAAQKRAREESPVNQLWRYMNIHATPYGIVTNYEMFVFFKYDVGSKKYYSFNFSDIKKNPDKLKEFIAIFSKEGMVEGFVETLHEKSVVEEREFTKEFYKLYHETRLMLIQEFETNEGIKRENAVHFAQVFLNRLMFVLFAEDVGLVRRRLFEEKLISSLSNINVFSNNSTNISSTIINMFRDFDHGSDFPEKIFGFNGGLFRGPIPKRIYFLDLRDERFFKDLFQNSELKKRGLELNEQEQQTIEQFKGKLNPLIKNILFMASFDFNTEVNVNILGHIFEQSISDIEDLKADSSERRKKDGIYYTPEYITDYICRNTIIPYLSTKGAASVPELIKEYAEDIETLEERFRTIKILDPACGSGAFLLKATDIMLEVFKAIQEHKEQQGEYDAKTGLKKKKSKKGQITLTKWREEDEARNIIESSIYGVDINEESVEITKLSLFLKMARKNRKLTDLSNNIKQGNSIIDDKEIVGSLAFKWEEEYKEIHEQGGFDVIIGNPPYGAKLTKEEIAYTKQKYTQSTSETAQMMMELSHTLLKKNGYHGFIIPKAFIYVSTWKKIREQFTKELQILIDCKKVWNEVKLEQIIYTIKKGKETKHYISGIRENEKIVEQSKIEKALLEQFDGNLLSAMTKQEIDLGLKIKTIKSTLEPLGKGSRGGLFYNSITEDKKDKKVLGGAEVQQFRIEGIKGFVESTEINKINNAHIKKNSVILQRIIAHIENPKDHIKITGTIFEDGSYSIVDTVYQITFPKETSNKFILAIINSKLINWFVYRFIFGKAIRSFQFSSDVNRRIPIPDVNLSEQKPFIEKADLMLALNKELQEKKNKFLKIISHEYTIDKISKKLEKFYELTFEEFLKQLKIKLSLEKKSELIDFFEKNKKELQSINEQIQQTDQRIDQMVYELYGLTKEEIKIVESS